MTKIDRDPVRLSSWVAVSVAVISLVASGFFSWSALAVGSVGLTLVGAGIGFGRTGGVTGGAFGLLVAALIAGTQGAPVVWVLLGVAAAVVAWDVGCTAISVGKQLGRAADTRRLEVVHLAASVGVGVVTTGAGYGLYQVGTGRQPVGALLFLLVAAVLLVVALE